MIKELLLPIAACLGGFIALTCMLSRFNELLERSDKKK